MTQPQHKTGFQNTPVLGVGLGLRTALLEQTLNASDRLGWVEITPENFMAKGGLAQHRLQQAQAVFPLVPHGVATSIGSTDPWDEQYLRSLEQLFTQISPPWFSDHLCFSSINSLYFNDLIPLPRTKATINHLVSRIQYLQDRFQLPFLIENPSYYMEYPQNTMSEVAFLTRIAEEADCGLLLDVNNIFVNGHNHQWADVLKDNAQNYLNELPLERVVQIHVAGHAEYPERLIDTHGAAVKDVVWQILDEVLSRCTPSGIMLERDLNIPDFIELEPELSRITQLWTKHYGTPPTAATLYNTDSQPKALCPL